MERLLCCSLLMSRYHAFVVLCSKLFNVLLCSSWEPVGIPQVAGDLAKNREKRNQKCGEKMDSVKKAWCTAKGILSVGAQFTRWFRAECSRGDWRIHLAGIGSGADPHHQQERGSWLEAKC